MKITPAGLFATIGGVLVAVGVLVAFLVVGPPGEVRARRLDDNRIQFLDALATQIESYQSRQGVLPDSLQRLSAESGLSPSQIQDPETGLAFEYRPTGAASYQLCARFAAAAGEDVATRWRHGPGRKCFDFQIKPRQPGPDLGGVVTPSPVPVQPSS